MFFISKWDSFSKEIDWYDHLIPNAEILSPMPRFLNNVSFLMCPRAGPMCSAQEGISHLSKLTCLNFPQLLGNFVCTTKYIFWEGVCITKNIESNFWGSLLTI